MTIGSQELRPSMIDTVASDSLNYQVGRALPYGLTVEGEQPTSWFPSHMKDLFRAHGNGAGSVASVADSRDGPQSHPRWCMLAT